MIISYQERDGWVIYKYTYILRTHTEYNKVSVLTFVCCFSSIDLHRVLFVYRSISTGLLPLTLQLVYTTPYLLLRTYFAFR